MLLMNAQKKMDCGVYAITHVDSGKKYIGSSVNFKQRLRVHKSYLRGNTHRNPYLQNAWNKYGEDAFTFAPVLVCAQSDLLFYEQLLMDGYKSYQKENGFNARQKAEGSHGYKMSLEERLKRSGKPSPFKGKKRPELYGKCGPKKGTTIGWNKGKRWNEKVKEKIRKALRNNPNLPEIRKRVGELRRGIPTGRKLNYTKELREKISIAQKKRFLNPEEREKSRLAKLGKKQDPYKSGNAVKTHCPRGHPYSGNNLYIHPKSKRRGCKECIKINGIKSRKNKGLS